MLRLGPLRLHWSLLLGLVLFCAPQPRVVLALGYLAILVAHVLGHALAVAGTALRVEGVFLHALGGELLGTGEVSAVRRSVIALSGVLAQGALLALALSVALPGEWTEAFVRRNGVMLLLNLIPVKPLDGALAWKLPQRLRTARRLRFRGEMRSSREVQKDVRDLLRKIRGGTRVR
jgi:stage IV sporulation protein FB